MQAIAVGPPKSLRLAHAGFDYPNPYCLAMLSNIINAIKFDLPHKTRQSTAGSLLHLEPQIGDVYIHGKCNKKGTFLDGEVGEVGIMMQVDGEAVFSSIAVFGKEICWGQAIRKPGKEWFLVKMISI